MKYLIVIVIFIQSVSLAQQTEEQSFDFRKTRWGMIKNEIIKSEDGEPSAIGDYNVFYKDDIVNLECIIGYNFELENKLTSSVYMFNESYAAPNSYIEDYKRINEILNKKYGEPIIDEMHWHDDLWRDKPSKWGNALASGGLSFSSEWETKRTKIGHILYCDEAWDFNHTVIYQAKIYLDEINKKKEVEDLDDF